MTTTLEIIDSAIKIGLGALISALATYKTTSVNHANEKNKEARQYKLKTLEMAAEKCDAYFISYKNFRNRLNGILRDREVDEEFDFPAEKYKSIRERDGALFESLDGVIQAQSRLTLIGETEVSAHLDEITKSIKEIRNLVILKKRAPSKALIQEKDEIITNAVESIQSELSLIFERIYK